MDTTLRYYAENAERFAAETAAVDFAATRERFLGRLDPGAEYDGIWACASLLHVPSAGLPDIFRRMLTALKPGGIIYASFKYGTFEGDRNGRRFTDFTEETFAAFLRHFPELTPEDQWISADVRPGRESEKRLNVILRKRSNHE